MQSPLRSLFVLLCLALALPAWANNKDQETIARFKKSALARQYFASAYGYAVFPTIGKGGVGIGAAGGKGRVYEHGHLIGESTMVQLSVGFQLGGQAYSQVVFFKDRRALEQFTQNGFEFGADASAVAITVGAEAQAGTSGASANVGVNADSKRKVAAAYVNGMAVLTLAKGGLMYQAALAGQKYTFSKK